MMDIGKKGFHKEMVKCTSITDLILKESFQKVKLLAMMVSIYILMDHIKEDKSKMQSLMERESLLVQLDLNMKANGKMTNLMEKVPKLTLMVLNMKETLLKESNRTIKQSINGQMENNTMVHLEVVIWKEKVNSS